MEPPLGFEVRLFERMGLTDGDATAPASPAVALGAGRGGRRRGGPGARSGPEPDVVVPDADGDRAQPNGTHRVVTAALVEDGETVGHVMTVAGAKPWISMMMADSSAHGRVNCVVVTDDGVTHRVGTFEADKGYGAWISPLPVNPDDLRAAEVVSPSGTVIATATLG